MTTEDGGQLPQTQRVVMPVGVGTEHDRFLFDWARESYKASIPLFNDTLGKVLTLSTALTGGGLALLDKAVMPDWAKIVTLLLFFTAIVSCVVGMFPLGGQLVLNPDMIRNQATNAISRKKCSLKVAVFALLIGLLFAIGMSAYQMFRADSASVTAPTEPQPPSSHLPLSPSSSSSRTSPSRP